MSRATIATVTDAATTDSVTAAVTGAERVAGWEPRWSGFGEEVGDGDGVGVVATVVVVTPPVSSSPLLWPLPLALPLAPLPARREEINTAKLRRPEI